MNSFIINVDIKIIFYLGTNKFEVLKMNKIPVFVFHKGNPSYLKFVIKQAEKYNEVHLLGDESNQKICKIWDKIENYIGENYLQFKKEFVQMSDYSLEFDLNCYKRFFVMYNYMISKNIDKMVFADSDLLIYTDFSIYFNNKNCSVALSIPYKQDNYRWTAQAQCSLWTRDALKNFLDYLLYTYKENLDKLKEKYNYHLSHNLKGGVCDMTLLYLWSKTYKGELYNIAPVVDNQIFDHNFGSSGNYYDNEYKFNKILRTKVVIFKSGYPYFINIKEKKLIKANVIHCQGSAKALIISLLKCKYGTLRQYMCRYTEMVHRFIKKKYK